MTESETPVRKNHTSGSWKVVRSMTVPASVTPAHLHEPLATRQSGTRKIHKSEEESILLKARKAPGYFETADTSLSKS